MSGVWEDVESELRSLAANGDALAVGEARSRVTGYDVGWRIRVENERGTSWVEIDDIKACWTTFEQQGRIRRRDVLEPGRCSAFMMALFARVPGVRREDLDETYLVLTR